MSQVVFSDQCFADDIGVRESRRWISKYSLKVKGLVGANLEPWLATWRACERRIV